MSISVVHCDAIIARNAWTIDVFMGFKGKNACALIYMSSRNKFIRVNFEHLCRHVHNFCACAVANTAGGSDRVVIASVILSKHKQLNI